MKAERTITRKPKAATSILQGAREALAFAQGERDGYAVHVPAAVDVKAIREGHSQ